LRADLNVPLETTVMGNVSTAGAATYDSPFRSSRDAVEGFGSSLAIRVFGREIEQPLLGEGVGMFRETSAAFCLFFQCV
jgi:hypothetical protein